eukprot:g1715.t1
MDRDLPGVEALHGMTLSSPYASNAAPDAAWLADMGRFLDRCAEVGFFVNYQLIAFESLDNSPGVLANLTAQVARFKDHPAVLSWYIADEPGGQGIAPDTLRPKYDAIRKADPGGKPVSMVFCTDQAHAYRDMLDVIMVDPYPVPNGPAASITGALDAVAPLGKPLMMVPQAFGGGENWARGPSQQEERVMTYLGLMRGVQAVQYFVRSADGTFPYAPAAWGTIRAIADEVRALTPALLGGKAVRGVTVAPAHGAPGGCAIEAAAWVDRDGSVVVLAASTANVDGPPCAFTVRVPVAAAGVRAFDVVAEFENRNIATGLKPARATASSRATTVAFGDALRGLATAVYRIQPAAAGHAEAGGGGNLVYNGDYETCVNPAVPDGHYVTQPADQSGFFWGEFRDSVSGRASLRLRAPSDGNGTSLAPYTLPKLNGSSVYDFSVWTKGAVGGETMQFTFSKAIFPGLAGPLYIVATKSWAQSKLTLTTTANITTACPYGCRSWLSYSLNNRGDVLIDNLSFRAASSG